MIVFVAFRPTARSKYIGVSLQRQIFRDFFIKVNQRQIAKGQLADWTRRVGKLKKELECG